MSYDEFLYLVHEERARRDGEGAKSGDVFMDLLRKTRPDVVTVLMGMLVAGTIDNESFRRDFIPPEIHKICEQLF